MVFSIFTDICSHQSILQPFYYLQKGALYPFSYCFLVLEHFDYLSKTSCPDTVNPIPAPGNHFPVLFAESQDHKWILKEMVATASGD